MRRGKEGRNVIPMTSNARKGTIYTIGGFSFPKRNAAFNTVGCVIAMRLLTTSLALASSVRGFASSSSQRSFIARHRHALRMSSLSSVSISDAFDGGNIKFIDSVEEGDHTMVILQIKSDP